VARLDSFDLAVFVSRNAVQHAVPLIRAQWPALPPRLHLAAVGAGTAEDLAAHGMPAQWVPHARLGTEGLLALGGLHHQAGQRVLIVRGQGGREVLGQSLRERGAEVHYAEVYRRVVPDLDVAPLLRRWQGGEVHLVVSTSNEGLQNLYQMLGEVGRTLLRAAYLVVLSPRAASLARELGFLHPATVATNPSDAALFDALKASAATHAGSLAKVKASL
jgi:uroporphyrinogen-III synthase